MTVKYARLTQPAVEILRDPEARQQFMNALFDRSEETREIKTSDGKRFAVSTTPVAPGINQPRR